MEQKPALDEFVSGGQQPENSGSQVLRAPHGKELPRLVHQVEVCQGRIGQSAIQERTGHFFVRWDHFSFEGQHHTLCFAFGRSPVPFTLTGIFDCGGRPKC